MRRVALMGFALAACVENRALPAPVDEPDEPDAGVIEEPWATYRIEPGGHTARVENRSPRNPIDGVASVVGRDYELAFDPSAMYVLTQPTQPEDQFDWNKLPGLSDCGTVDLSVDGAMFGWRWNVEQSVLEIIAYANNDKTHLWLDAPLFTLDANDLESQTPLRYRVARGVDTYSFAVTGTVGGRTIDVTATLPRRCTQMQRDPLAWAGAFYFGGTSVAPQLITAQMREREFLE